jgi:hypothetical protein
MARFFTDVIIQIEKIGKVRGLCPNKLLCEKIGKTFLTSKDFNHQF